MGYTSLNVVRFSDIPPQGVRDALKANGFWWDRSRGAWVARASVRTALVADYFSKGPCDPSGLAEYVALNAMMDDCGI